MGILENIGILETNAATKSIKFYVDTGWKRMDGQDETVMLKMASTEFSKSSLVNLFNNV